MEIARSRSSSRLLWVLGSALALALAGCSQHDDDSEGHDEHSGHSGSSGAAGAGGGASACGAGAQTYTPGMEVQGASGLFKVKLVSMSAVPPANGTNSWEIQVLDAQGAPVDGATLTAKPFMPAHGHGSSTTPTITAKGGGQYTVDALVFSMPGVWQTTLGVTAPQGTDSVVFSFCVPG
jgi:hypothetical protein